ncbi:hypothetical protein EDC04DRAFT_2635779 [Pisolithus marmoratus]|nr:hypothetical protein EDC04DRAFT_2635779 [Pisolithus marmoratus]
MLVALPNPTHLRGRCGICFSLWCISWPLPLFSVFITLMSSTCEGFLHVGYVANGVADWRVAPVRDQQIAEKDVGVLPVCILPRSIRSAGYIRIHVTD